MWCGGFGRQTEESKAEVVWACQKKRGRSNACMDKSCRVGGGGKENGEKAQEDLEAGSEGGPETFEYQGRYGR